MRKRLMPRRHNRHFHLDDDLIMCYGKAKDDNRCHNWGKPDENGKYWCHVHKSQSPSA